MLTILAEAVSLTSYWSSTCIFEKQYIHVLGIFKNLKSVHPKLHQDSRSIQVHVTANISPNDVTFRSRFGTITSEYISMDYCSGNCFAKSPGLFKELPYQITACVPLLTSSLIVEYKNQVFISLLMNYHNFSSIDTLSKTFLSRSVPAEEPLVVLQTNSPGNIVNLFTQELSFNSVNKFRYKFSKNIHVNYQYFLK